MASSSSKLAASSTPTAVPIPAKPDILPSYYGKNVIVAGVIDLVRLDICKQLLEKGVKNLGIITNVKDISVNEPEGITNLRMRYTDSIIMHASVDIMQRPIIETKILQMIEKFKSTGDDVITHFIICSAVLKDDKIQQIQDVEFFNVINLTLSGLQILNADVNLSDTVQHANVQVNPTSAAENMSTIGQTSNTKHFKTQNGGDLIVLLPIDAALVVNKNFPVYSAKRHAINGYMLKLSTEYKRDTYKINYSTICYKYKKPINNTIESKFSIKATKRTSLSQPPALNADELSDIEIMASLIGNDDERHKEVIWHIHNATYGPLKFQFNVVNLTLVGIKLFSKIDPRLTDIVSGVPSVHTDIRTTLLGYGGVVVVLLPVDDRIPNTNFPAYSAKKHAISGFMISLSEEYIFDKFGVKFINICYKYSKKMQMVTPAAETTLTPDLSTSSGSSGDAFVVSTSDLSSISSSAMSSNNNSGSASSGASKKSKDTELIASLIGNNIHHTEVIWHVHDGEYGPLHFARYTP